MDFGDYGMSNIEELERRITAALDQIGQGLDGLQAETGPIDTSEIDGLRSDLADERAANAQLEERLKAIHKTTDAKLEALEKSSEDTKASLSNLDSELQRLRTVNTQLRENNHALREANEAGVGEPHLINKAMLAELDALRAARNVDAAEAKAIMSAMAPLLANSQNGADPVTPAPSGDV